MFVQQEHDPAAPQFVSIIELQVLATVLIAGGRAVAGGKGEAAHADYINTLALARRTARA